MHTLSYEHACYKMHQSDWSENQNNLAWFKKTKQKTYCCKAFTFTLRQLLLTFCIKNRQVQKIFLMHEIFAQPFQRNYFLVITFFKQNFWHFSASILSGCPVVTYLSCPYRDSSLSGTLQRPIGSPWFFTVRAER